MEAPEKNMPVYKDNKTGTWYVSKRYQDWDGKERRLFKRNFATKKEAKEYESSFISQKKGNPSIRFRDFIEIYYEDRRQNTKPSTFLTKKNVIETCIRPYFDNFRLADITPKEVMKWQNAMLNKTCKTGRKYSKETLRATHAQLSSIFNHAVRYYGLYMNPAQIVGTIKNDEVKEPNVWTVDEYRRFSEAISNKPIIYMAFEVLFWCGLRIGELMALTPEDIDFENKTLHICKSLQRIGGEDVITTPKTKRSNRYVDMPEFLSDELKNYMENLYQVETGQRVFPITKNGMYHEMQRGCKASGVKKIRIHDLRHSHVSMLMEQGVSPIYIANRVGHEAIQITYHYAHSYDTKGKEIANLLEKLEDKENES